MTWRLRAEPAPRQPRTECEAGSGLVHHTPQGHPTGGAGREDPTRIVATMVAPDLQRLPQARPRRRHHPGRHGRWAVRPPAHSRPSATTKLPDFCLAPTDMTLRARRARRKTVLGGVTSASAGSNAASATARAPPRRRTHRPSLRHRGGLIRHRRRRLVIPLHHRPDSPDINVRHLRRHHRHINLPAIRTTAFGYAMNQGSQMPSEEIPLDAAVVRQPDCPLITHRARGRIVSSDSACAASRADPMRRMFPRHHRRRHETCAMAQVCTGPPLAIAGSMRANLRPVRTRLLWAFHGLGAPPTYSTEAVRCYLTLL